jgi:hypothetical protein
VTLDLLDPLDLIQPYFIANISSGSSMCGVVLAVDFHDFYHQHFPGFHTFIAKIMLKLFILMSSTSFCEYLILGAHYINFSQIGRKPRPMGLP